MIVLGGLLGQVITYLIYGLFLAAIFGGMPPAA